MGKIHILQVHGGIANSRVPISPILSEIKPAIPPRAHGCGVSAPILVALGFALAHPAELVSVPIESEDAFSFLAAVLFDPLLKGLAILVLCTDERRKERQQEGGLTPPFRTDVYKRTDLP